MVCCGVLWRAVVRCGVLWCAVACCGVMMRAMVSYDVLLCAVKRHYLENYNGYMMNYIGNGSIRACRAAKMTLSVYSLPM